MYFSSVRVCVCARKVLSAVYIFQRRDVLTLTAAIILLLSFSCSHTHTLSLSPSLYISISHTLLFAHNSFFPFQSLPSFISISLTYFRNLIMLPEYKKTEIKSEGAASSKCFYIQVRLDTVHDWTVSLFTSSRQSYLVVVLIAFLLNCFKDFLLRFYRFVFSFLSRQSCINTER